MRRIAKNVHFSDWAKVREGLIARDVTDITANSTDKEVRTFLENTSSEVNPFYYDIVYIKSTKEIYTHGQFYPGNFYITDFYVDDLINIAGDGTKSIPVGRVFSAVRDRKIIYVPYGLDGGSYGGFIANATSTEDWYSLIIYTRDSIITAYVDKGDDLSNFWGNYVSVEPLLFNSSLKTINGQSIVGTGNITIDANSNVIEDGSITAEKLADGIANDIISSLSTQSTLPSLTDYYIGQNAGGHTETYFKKTLQSIGSVFQHELYDKVYLKDGSDPTFGNITAGQLNLSENSGVFYAGGVGLALCVNDCAFYVGEEDGVYYIDAAGNTQTMLHSGNIGNYNAGSATKLQTPRTLWGQSFDGTKNITHGFRSLYADSYNGGVAHSILNCQFTPYGLLTRIFGNGSVSLQAQREANNAECFNLLLNHLGGNVGIGNTSPTEKLDVAGNIKANSFIGNASSATKLQTARILWGKSFDGTSSISGTIHLGGDLENAAGGIYIHKTNEINSFNGKLYLNHRGGGLPDYGSTNDIVMVANGGNVGIGTSEATEKLDVVGNVKASGNIQCSNLITTGVINQLNNSYIVHNAVSNGDHKMWITDGTGKSISAGSAFASDALNIISDTSLLLVAHLDYNIRVLKANNRIAKVIDSYNYSTLLPYKTPVAISNTYSSNPHNVAMADNTLYIVNENEADDLGCTILSFPTNDGSTPLTCGLLYTTYADSTGEFSCPAVTWSYGLTPMISMDKTYEIWFTSYDGGYSWYGTYTEY